MHPRLNLAGIVLSEGIALGHVVLHEPRVVVKNFIADDVPKELKRLDDAIATLRSDVDVMLERGEIADGGEHRDVLEAYRMFAHDRGWLQRMREAVMTGLTAEAGVERVQSDNRARMLRAIDPYLRERLHDLDELANRLMRQLMGVEHAPRRDQLPENAVLVARMMGPAALLDYDRKKLRGLVLEEGGPTSHVAIVARALGHRCGRRDSQCHRSGRGRRSDHCRWRRRRGLSAPAARHRERLCRARASARAPPGAISGAARQAVLTKDGQEIALLINAGLLVDLPHIAETGAAGIGLFRTELQFMVATAFPRINEQLSLYRAVLDAADKLPVTFRTLDIGGDKVLPYMRAYRRGKSGDGLARHPARPRPARA